MPIFAIVIGLFLLATSSSLSGNNVSLEHELIYRYARLASSAGSLLLGRPLLRDASASSAARSANPCRSLQSTSPGAPRVDRSLQFRAGAQSSASTTALRAHKINHCPTGGMARRNDRLRPLDFPRGRNAFQPRNEFGFVHTKRPRRSGRIKPRAYAVSEQSKLPPRRPPLFASTCKNSHVSDLAQNPPAIAKTFSLSPVRQSGQRYGLESRSAFRASTSRAAAFGAPSACSSSTTSSRKQGLFEQRSAVLCKFW
jgi:hypothetical protein